MTEKMGQAHHDEYTVKANGKSQESIRMRRVIIIDAIY